MPIRIRYDNKNGVLSQRLDILPVTPKVMLYFQASYTTIVAVFGVLCGSIGIMLGIPVKDKLHRQKSRETTSG